MFRFIVLILLSLAIAVSYSSSSINETINLIAMRASLMKNVASCKFSMNHQMSAYSAKQELLVLHNAQEVAEKNHFNTNSFLLFIQIQMDLSKQIETYWIDHWNNSYNQNYSNEVNCLSSLRLKIKKIDDKLYPKIRESIPQFKSISNKALAKKIRNTFMGFKGNIIKGVPDNPDYFELIAMSLKYIQSN